MNTFYKAALFSYIACASIQALDVRPAFANDEKKFMEYVFIEGYNNQKAAFNNFAKNIISYLGAGVLAYKYYSLPNNTQKETAKILPTAPSESTSTAPAEPAPKKSPETLAALFIPELTPKNVVGSIITAFLAQQAYAIYQNHITRRASALVLTNFLEEWDINKEYTPENYHPFFHELAKMYDMYGEEFFDDCAQEIVEGLQFIIKRTELKVSEVYKKEFENNASGSTIFDTPKFLGEILKHSKEVIKL